MFDTKKFGAYLSDLRKKHDMTQSALADILNVTRQAVSKWETAESFPDISLLAALATTFNVSIDTLINSGEPTQTEAKIMQDAALNSIIPAGLISKDNAEEIVNIAPLFKPSMLDNMAETLAKQGIDISSVVALAEYMNSGSVAKLLESSSFGTIDEIMLGKLMPFLDSDSKERIFEKILERELDYKLIRVMRPYMDSYFNSLVEAAVLEGFLDKEELQYI